MANDPATSNRRTARQRPDGWRPWRRVLSPPSAAECWALLLAHRLPGDATVRRPGVDPNGNDDRRADE
jgi:hypothetical protein